MGNSHIVSTTLPDGTCVTLEITPPSVPAILPEAELAAARAQMPAAHPEALDRDLWNARSEAICCAAAVLGYHEELDTPEPGLAHLLLRLRQALDRLGDIEAGSRR